MESGRDSKVEQSLNIPFRTVSGLFVFDGEGSTFCDVLVQGLEALLLVFQIFRSSDEFLYGFDIKKLVDIVVVSQEIGWDFSRPFELSVFSDDGLDLFHESVFGVVAGDVGGSGCRRIEASWPLRTGRSGGARTSAVRSRLIEANFQKNSILEASD